VSAGALPADTVDAEPPNVIRVDVRGEKLIYFRYRTGGGPWSTPEHVGSEYVFRVYDDYEVVSVCGDDIVGYHVAFEARVSEYDLFLLLCRAPAMRRERVSVTGTMIQAGRVAMVETDIGATDNWQFELQMPRGTWGLVATTNDQVMVRRAVEITGPMQIADVDVNEGGAPLSDLALTVNGLEADEVVSTRSWWGTSQSVQMFLDQPGTTARMVPDSLMSPGEIRMMELDAVAPPQFRSTTIRRWNPPVSTTQVKLLSRMEAAFTDDGVAWSSLPVGHQAVLQWDSGRNRLHFHATPGWLRKRTSISVDWELPDFRPEWGLGPLDYRDFAVITATFDHETSNEVVMRSGIWEELAPAPSVRRRRADMDSYIGDPFVAPTASSGDVARAL
jgi:hypothetical protein